MISLGMVLTRRAGSVRERISEGRVTGHFSQDMAEGGEIIAFLTQEPGQQEMGEPDRFLRSIREDEDDIDLREESPEPQHPPKLATACGEKNGDRIRFDGHPESFLEIFQASKPFDRTVRDRLMNGRLESLTGLIHLFRIT
jgi:hypothetical protein